MNEVNSLVAGLWRRGAMRYPDGRVDDTTRVFWLQTSSLYADIRVPADLTCRSEVTSFDDLTDDEMIDLARLYGFAGTLDFDGTICRWRRELDYHPPGGPPDEARARIDRDTLIETGIHAEYIEDWHRQTEADAALLAFRATDGVAGILVVAGDFFIEVRERPAPLPANTKLSELVIDDLARHDHKAAAAKLGLRISYGRRPRLARMPWRIELSTFPWLAGTPLFAEAVWDAGGRRLTMDGGSRIWSLEESSIDPAALARWFH